MTDSEFAGLLVSEIPRLKRHAWRLTRDRDLADDLTQETLLRAWEARDRFEPGTNLEVWTSVILANLSIDMKRREGRWGRLLGQRVDYESVPVPATQESEFEARELCRKMSRAAPKSWQAFIAVNVFGYDYEEAAGYLRCKMGTVGSGVFHARRLVYEAMST